MGRKRYPAAAATGPRVEEVERRAALSYPDELPLSQAAARALAALGTEATVSEVERWIKEQHSDVWMHQILHPRVLVDAVEAARLRHTALAPNGASRVSRKKPIESPSLPIPPLADPPRVGRPAAAERDPVHANPPPVAEEAPSNPQPPAPREPRANAKAARVAPLSDSGLSAEDLVRVAQIAKQEGSIAALRKQVLSIQRLADQVGGLDRLASALDRLTALRELMGE